MNPRTTRAPRAPLTFAAAFAAALVVAGCSLSRPSPVKQTYLIEPAPPAAVATPQPASLRVGTIGVAVPYRGRPFVVRVGDLRYETDFYSEFLVAPESMLGEATARALGGARVFARVLAPGAPADADYVLDGFASALYEDLRSGTGPAADIAVTFYLARADNPVPFWSKEYRQHVPLAAASPGAYAAGLSTGFGAIMAELARDLAAIDLAKP